RPCPSVRRCGDESWPGHGSGTVQLPGDYRGERVGGPVAFVVLDDEIELVLLLELPPRDRDPLLDRPRALGRPQPQTALELLYGRRDEDRHRPGFAALHPERALRLELEHRRFADAAQPVDLGAQRPVAVPDVVDVLEELTCIDPRLEVVVVEEVVLDA